MKLDDLHKGLGSKEGESANTQVLIKETKTEEKEIHATIDYPYNICKSNQRKNKVN